MSSASIGAPRGFPRGQWRGVLVALGVLATALLSSPSPAFAHPAAPTTPLGSSAGPSLIPPEDEARYRSRVTAIVPPIPGLEARIVGGQEKIEVTWTGSEPLVIEGAEGEPMLRFGPAEIEVNERSPSAYASSERFGRVDSPPGADPDAPPRWRPIAPPGSFSWFEHRAQWMLAARPENIGDGTSATTIRDWTVSLTVGGREAAIEGTLSWVPDPAAIREQRSKVSSPVISALVLIAAMALGALIGVRLGPRLTNVRAAD